MNSICFISWEYPVSTNFGGIAFYVQSISQKFALNGYATTVISANFNGQTVRYTDEVGVNLFLIGASSHDDFCQKIEKTLEMLISAKNNEPFNIIESAEFYGDCRYIEEIHKYCKFKITRLHGCSLKNFFYKESNWFMFFYPLIRNQKIKNLKRLRRYFKSNLTSAILTDYYERRETVHADIVTAPSIQLIGFAENCWKIRNIEVFPNPSTRKIEGNRRIIKDFSKNRITISFIGTLSIQKGFDLFIDFLESLNVNENVLNGRNLIVNICGSFNEDTKTIEQWENRIAKINTGERIAIQSHGWLKKEEINKILEDSHFLFLLSRFDNFPNVHIEAMVYGCLVICGFGSGTHYLSKLVSQNLCFTLYNCNNLLRVFVALFELDIDELNRLSIKSTEIVKEQIIDFDHIGFYKSLVSKGVI